MPTEFDELAKRALKSSEEATVRHFIHDRILASTDPGLYREFVRKHIVTLREQADEWENFIRE